MSEQHHEWARAEERTLARYVNPNDIGIELQWPSYVHRLDLLQVEGPSGVLGQLYSLVRKRGIQYDLAPFNPRAGITQLIRKPKTILREGRGTCLDLAVLFATMVLSSNLLPLIVIVDGHAFIGISLTRTRHDAKKSPKSFAWDRGKLTDLNVLQELLGQEYLFLECTGAAQTEKSLAAAFPEGRGRESSGAMSYERACEAGREQIIQHLRALNERDSPSKRLFLYALDVHDLQVNQGFEPLQGNEPSGPIYTAFDQRGQNVHTQTNIAGDVRGAISSGNLQAPVHHGDITVGDITDSTGIAIGSGAQSDVRTEINNKAIIEAFRPIRDKINTMDPGPNKASAEQAVQALETEARKGDAANEGNVEKWFTFLAQSAADAWEVALATLAHPAAGVGKVIQLVAARAKEEKGKQS
jgi:hypothetical protein